MLSAVKKMWLRANKSRQMGTDLQKRFSTVFDMPLNYDPGKRLMATLPYVISILQRYELQRLDDLSGYIDGYGIHSEDLVNQVSADIKYLTKITAKFLDKPLQSVEKTELLANNVYILHATIDLLGLDKKLLDIYTYEHQDENPDPEFPSDIAKFHFYLLAMISKIKRNTPSEDDITEAAANQSIDVSLIKERVARHNAATADMFTDEVISKRAAGMANHYRTSSENIISDVHKPSAP